MSDPAEELAALTHALARHVRRRAVLSRRTFEFVPRTAPQAARAPIPPTATSPRAPTAPTPVPIAARPAASIPTAIPASIPTSATSSTTSTAAPGARPPLPARPTSPRPPLPTTLVGAVTSTSRSPAAVAGPASPTPDETPDMTSKKTAAPAPARTAQDVQEQARGARTLAALRERVAACEACDLCRTRTQTVFMDGTGSRRVMFVGEAPGADEDRTGVPFVGRSGQLLTDIITKGMGIPREEVVIANVLKCRPPDNREPTAAEKTVCTPWLDRQIELLDPQVIIPLGRHAAMHVLNVQAPMGAMRQRVHEVRGRKIVPTFHPSYLLRSPGEKKECWKDIQLAMDILGLAPPKTTPKSAGGTG